MNKLTKRQFDTLTNQVIRLGKEIANIDGYSTSIAFEKDYISFCVHNYNSHDCSITYFSMERYMSVREIKELLGFTNGLQLNYGKYLTIIMDAYKDADKSEIYFNFQKANTHTHTNMISDYSKF